ncbi:hypothetical protein BH11PSE1_BH11PSE1_32410 [soil metagenome]
MRLVTLMPLAAALLLAGTAQAQAPSVAPLPTPLASGVRVAIGDVTDAADKPTPPTAGKAQNRHVEVKLSKATDDDDSDTAGKTAAPKPTVEFKDSVRTARELGSR